MAPPALDGDLRFPGKVMALPGGTFLTSDTGHHRLLELDGDLSTVLRIIGEGTRGHVDGGPDAAQFNEPQGLARLPKEVAEKVGYDLVVADTVNHRLRGVQLATGQVVTIAGNGIQGLLDARRAPAPQRGAASSGASATDLGTDPLDASLSSPWDVLWSTRAGRLLVAMAGTHQIFSFDPTSGTLAVLAGTGQEGLRDGAPVRHGSPSPPRWLRTPRETSGSPIRRPAPCAFCAWTRMVRSRR